MPSVAYDFSHDFYALGCLMYSFYKENLVLSPQAKLFPEWDVREDNYKRLHLKHLIQVIFTVSLNQTQLNSRVLCGDFMSHPFFQSEMWMSEFEDRFRTYSTADRDMDRELENGKCVVFKGNFISKLDSRIQNHVRTKLAETCKIDVKKVGFKFLDLWKAIRNRKHHRDRDPPEIRAIMGTVPVDYFLHWANNFPYFFLFLYLRVAERRPFNKLRLSQDPEFSHYFPAQSHFYETCFHIRLA